MSGLETASLQCPYCWESIEVVVDCSVSEQDYIEDCSVCCRPIVISVWVDDEGLVEISGRAEDE